jgi:hypothetical protein
MFGVSTWQVVPGTPTISILFFFFFFFFFFLFSNIYIKKKKNCKAKNLEIPKSTLLQKTNLDGTPDPTITWKRRYLILCLIIIRKSFFGFYSFRVIKFMSLLTVVLKQFLHKRNADCFKFVPFLQIKIFPLEKPNSNQTFQHVILCFRLSSSRCTSYWCKYSDTPYASFYICFQLSSAEDLTSYNVFCF